MMNHPPDLRKLCAIEAADPHNLASVAHLLGHTPPACETARILEIGCGDGGNLVPLAARLPQAQLIGIDSSAAAVAAAQTYAARVNAENVRILHLVWEQFEPELGSFDYILCHDLYALNPVDDRTRLLSLCKRHLAPHGVAYVSYQAAPAHRVYSGADQCTRNHCSNVELGDHAHPTTASYKHALTDTTCMGLGQLYRDDAWRPGSALDNEADTNYVEAPQPANFCEFAHDLERHGLQFVGEARIPDLLMSNCAAYATPAHDQVDGGDIVMADPNVDFLTARTYRQVLICHRDIVLDRCLTPQRLDALALCSNAIRAKNEEGTTFVTHTGHTVSNCSVQLTKALGYLAHRFPSRISLHDLYAALGLMEVQQQEALRAELLLCVCHGIVDVSWRTYAAPGAIHRPCAWPVAREQARHQYWASNVLHQVLDFRQRPLHAAALILLNGTVTIHDLIGVLTRRALSGRLQLHCAGEVITAADHIKRLVAAEIPEVVTDLTRFGFLMESP